MINFKEELAKYRPIMELDQIESSLHPSQMQDLLDILQHIANEKQKESAKDAVEETE
ncbi:hypothetical protein H9X85_01940 [Anaerotignum lactatifermentans]|uniref:Uncharacterized protein n=1 Tax=Anaerotignum lactatifermentans TaxID=160404 RepID=A0ABS2G872_9FIRM|nr:hypothetical protein [Anaerotignum lactatifermentans]MBM6828391.1 hypothetical protein [Anaerotignum lactatifermentans]MBM6877671.1 hypothetical protein [Anaerotignum lactatifermentans]MBM6949974.1 hypothetical protein [Anaerotignum lactatifermentans]